MQYIHNFLLFLLFAFFSGGTIQAKVNYTEADSLIFENYVTQFSKDVHLPINELLVKTATYLERTPYVSSTLEHSENEELTINLREFDCTTFVESCLALSQTIKSGNYTFSNYCHLLQKIRYRNGNIEDYSSRLHYVSDWIFEHESDRMLKNISKSMLGNLINKQINFMSIHPDAYRQLAKNKDLQIKIKKYESELNKRGGLYVISKGNICTVDNSMKNGDIVVFSTNIPGLDFSHIGIITTENGVTSFIHASSSTKKVVTEQKSLNDYCKNSKRCNGVVILRLNE